MRLDRRFLRGRSLGRFVLLPDAEDIALGILEIAHIPHAREWPAGDRPVTPKSAWVFQNLLDTSHPEFGMAVGTTPEEAKYLPRASLPTNIDLRT